MINFEHEIKETEQRYAVACANQRELKIKLDALSEQVTGLAAVLHTLHALRTKSATPSQVEAP
jgi:hypothetical protein